MLSVRSPLAGSPTISPRPPLTTCGRSQVLVGDRRASGDDHQRDVDAEHQDVDEDRGHELQLEESRRAVEQCQVPFDTFVREYLEWRVCAATPESSSSGPYRESGASMVGAFARTGRAARTAACGLPRVCGARTDKSCSRRQGHEFTIRIPTPGPLRGRVKARHERRILLRASYLHEVSPGCPRT